MDLSNQCARPTGGSDVRPPTVEPLRESEDHGHDDYKRGGIVALEGSHLKCVSNWLINSLPGQPSHQTVSEQFDLAPLCYAEAPVGSRQLPEVNPSCLAGYQEAKECWNSEEEA